jgi:hypothetical protein
VAEAKIFEEAKVKLLLKVDKGQVTEKQAEFTLLVEGQPHSTHTADLDGSAFNWPTTAPKVDDPKVPKWPYELKYQVKHDGHTYHGVDEWEVWPKTLQLEPKGNDGPAQLKILQNDKVVATPPKIDKDATGTATLKAPALSTVQSVFPWKVKDGGVTDAGRKRTVQLEKIAYRVKFVQLDGGNDAGTPIEQLVNVKTESEKGCAGKDHKGEMVDLNIKVTGVDPAKYDEAIGTLVNI